MLMAGKAFFRVARTSRTLSILVSDRTASIEWIDGRLLAIWWAGRELRSAIACVQIQRRILAKIGISLVPKTSLESDGIIKGVPKNDSTRVQKYSVMVVQRTCYLVRTASALFGVEGIVVRSAWMAQSFVSIRSLNRMLDSVRSRFNSLTHTRWKLGGQQDGTSIVKFIFCLVCPSSNYIV